MLLYLHVKVPLIYFEQLYFNATDPLSELWQIYWIIPAFWILLAYALLVVICVLWAPSRNPTRYGKHHVFTHCCFLFSIGTG